MRDTSDAGTAIVTVSPTADQLRTTCRPADSTGGDARSAVRARAHVGSGAEVDDRVEVAGRYQEHLSRLLAAFGEA